MDKEIRKVDDVRDDITKIDYEIAELFEKRMGFAAELALSKKQAGDSIYNKNKEDEKLSDITKNRSNPFVIKGLEEVFIQMMSISRKYQYHLFGSGKLKDLEQSNENLRHEIAKRDKSIDELKAKMQQMQEQHDKQIRNIQGIHNQELEAKDKEISRLNTILEKALCWFPLLKEMLRNSGKKQR